MSDISIKIKTSSEVTFTAKEDINSLRKLARIAIDYYLQTFVRADGFDPSLFSSRSEVGAAYSLAMYICDRIPEQT